MAFKPDAHAFNRKLKCLPWVICSKCGMVRLKNPFSNWCAQNGCNHDEHPNYETERLKASPLTTP